MIKQKIQEEINDQIQAEFQSAYMYLAFSGWFDAQDLSGFAHWMKKQWEEEIEHGMKFHHHLLSREGSVELKTIDAPNISIDTPLEAFELALEQERNITKRIHKLYDLAQQEGDYPLETLLHWFIDEQVEEQELISQTVEALKRIDGDGTGLMIMDEKMAKREQ